MGKSGDFLSREPIPFDSAPSKRGDYPKNGNFQQDVPDASNFGIPPQSDSGIRESLIKTEIRSSCHQ